jgi:hypothetical protein
VITVSFEKHDLKGVLKFIGVEICTQYPSPLSPPQTLTDVSIETSQSLIDIAVKSNSTVGIL